MGIEQRRSLRPLPGRVTFQSPLAARLDTECLAQAAAAFLVRRPSLCCRGCRRCVARSSPFVPLALFLFFSFHHEAGDVRHCAFLQSMQRNPVKWRLFVGSDDGGRCAASVLFKFLEFKKKRKPS